MGYVYNGDEDNLCYVVDEIFEVMASNSISNDCDLKGWDVNDLVNYVGYREGNVKELAELIIDKVNGLEKDYGTSQAIEIFREANVNLLKDNELGQLFDKIDKVKLDFDKIVDVKPEVKVKSNKLKI